MDPMTLQTSHHPTRILFGGPFANQFIELCLMFFSRAVGEKARVRKPLWFVRDATKAFPLCVIPTTNHAPLSIATWVTSVWRDYRVAIPVSASHLTVGRIVEQGPAQELQAGFILREVDVNPFSGSQAVVQRRQHSDAAVGHRDEIYVGSIQEIRWAFRFTDEISEAAQ